MKSCSLSAPGGRSASARSPCRAQASLDLSLALAAAEEAALAALFEDEILDVRRVHVGHDLAQPVQRRALGLLDGGRAGDGGELGLLFLFVDRLEVVRLFHRSCSLVGVRRARRTLRRQSSAVGPSALVFAPSSPAGFGEPPPVDWPPGLPLPCWPPGLPLGCWRREPALGLAARAPGPVCRPGAGPVCACPCRVAASWRRARPSWRRLRRRPASPRSHPSRPSWPSSPRAASRPRPATP